MKPKNKRANNAPFLSGVKSPKKQEKPRGSVWAQWLAANANALGLSSKEVKTQLLEKPFYKVVAERGLSRVSVLADISSQLVGYFQATTAAAGRLAVQLTTVTHTPKPIDVIAAKQARRAP